MAALSNTFTTPSQVGVREDLTDMIWLISPTQTPFMSGIRRGDPAEQIKHEWQIDALASAAANFKPEGDDVQSAGFDAVTATTRPNNYCQISYKSVIVSGTAREVNTAGRRDELSYQIAKKGKELKRDMEFALTQNQAIQSTDPRKIRGLENWYSTNSNLGASGANSVAGAARTDGTQRAFTESLLKDVLKQVVTAGGDPNLIMVGPFNKQVVSSFTGNATRTNNAQDRKVVAAIDVYQSDYGNLTVQFNRFQRERSAHVLETEKWGLCFLRPFQVQPLAKTGDAEKAMIVAEYTLEASNEAASGIVADLTTS